MKIILFVLFQDTVMKYYLSKGASKSKLIVGIPFYGQSFTTRSTPRAYSEETDGPGTAGTWTKQRGMLAYYEICSKGEQRKLLQHVGLATYIPTKRFQYHKKNKS